MSFTSMCPCGRVEGHHYGTGSRCSNRCECLGWGQRAREIPPLDALLYKHLAQVSGTDSREAIEALMGPAEAAIRAVDDGAPETVLPFPGGSLDASQVVDLMHLAAFLDEGWRDQ